MDDDLIIAKIIILTIIGLTSVAFGCLPILLERIFSLKTICSQQNLSNDVKKFLLCFGGGVLFFTSFIHLHPEVRLTFNDLEKQHIFHNTIKGLGIQTSELLICVGFFIVYILEEVMHYAIDHPRDQHEFVLHRTLSTRKCASTGFDHQCNKSRRQNNISNNINNNNNNNNNNSSSSNKFVDCQLERSSTSIPSNSKNCVDESLPMECPISLFEPTTLSSDVRQEYQQHALGHSSVSLLENGCNSRDTSSCNSIEKNCSKPDFSSLTTTTATTKENLIDMMRGLITIFALSIHALFEGLALGLEQNFSSVWYLFFAIGTHKFVIIFCVGMELIAAKIKPLTIFIYIVGFAAVTPIGILIGALIMGSESNVENRSDVLLIISAFLQAMATGTLLYVIFFEILVKERDLNGRGFIQIFAIACGFLFMMAMHAIVSGHQHTHSHGDGDSHQHQHDEHENLQHHDHDGHDHNQMVESLDDQLKMLRDAFESLNQAVARKKLN